MKKFLGLGTLLLLLLTGACGEEDVNLTGGDKPETEIPEAAEEPAEEPEIAEEEETEEIDLTAYFMEDGTTAHFKGEGNEFAELDIRTDYLDADYVALYEDNGGTTMLRVYRLTDDRIELVKEQPEFYETYTATREELDALEPLSTHLETPIALGDQVNGMDVVELDATVETPYETFDNAAVLELENEDGSINRSYLVEGYGEVKREFLMEDEGESFAVTSSLETVE